MTTDQDILSAFRTGRTTETIAQQIVNETPPIVDNDPDKQREVRDKQRADIFNRVKNVIEMHSRETADLAIVDLRGQTAGHPTENALNTTVDYIRYLEALVLGARSHRAINCGGDKAGSYSADRDFNQGGSYTDGSTLIDIDPRLDLNAAPQPVYQTCRVGREFTYTIPGLVADRAYTVLLHWAELIHTAAGKRLMHVSLNDTNVLSAFDVFAAAGYKRAVSRSFNVTADSSGTIKIALAPGGAGECFLSGIEIMIPIDTNQAPILSNLQPVQVTSTPEMKDPANPDQPPVTPDSKKK